MKTKREFKSGPQLVKSIEGRRVEGVFSVFGVKDDYDDIIHPGAFAKTITERAKRTLFLWQHDFGAPPIATIQELREIGRDELPASILAEYPEATGGAVVVREYLDTPRGNEVLSAIKAGAPLQMSFGFDAIRFDFETREGGGDKVRHLRELRLWETSDVLWGANPATVAAKAALSIPLETLVGQIEAHLAEMKAGARNAAADLDRIRTIAALAVELGADNVVLSEAKSLDSSPADSDAEPERVAPPLTSLADRIRILNLPM